MAESVVPVCSQQHAFHLLDQLLLILNSDPLIDEMGFVHPSLLQMLKEEEAGLPRSSKWQEFDEGRSSEFYETDTYKSQNAFFWSREHKLGISTEYLLPLYKAGKNRFMNAYASYKMQATCVLSEIEDELMKHSKALLLLSSDFGTAWNARKLIISKRDDFSILDELHISALVLSFAPKSENAWSYRRWVIKRIAGRCATPTLEDILENESKIVEKIAEKSKMNYRAWNHRCWLIPFMTSQQVLHELNTNKKWATSHVADSSCFHYRRKLMLQMLRDSSPERSVKTCSYQFGLIHQLWKDELDWNESLIRRYIGREALWLHRRFLSVCWVNHFGANQDGSSEQSSEKGVEDNHASDFIDKEVGLLHDCIGLPDSIFEDVQSQISHCASYIMWLNRELRQPSNINLSEKLGVDNLRTLLNELCPEKTEVWNCLLHQHSL
ncbi:uncharacterized protein LOC141604583 [Silene latifolia]|uniref:uncharacterized protein LOC141604583 n=1 Tax=Silene latifolia TaxID=37657 RepID=UPI003D76BAB3